MVKTSEIEGEMLNAASVRSSIARRLGVDIGALLPADRHVEGVVEMVLDATARSAEPLTAERLFGWHAALSPTGYSSMGRIATSQWRDDADGPMQVVSGPAGRRKVHYEAPPARRLRGQAHQQQVGRHRQVLARHRAARHRRFAGAGRAEEIAGRRCRCRSAAARWRRSLAGRTGRAWACAARARPGRFRTAD